MADYFPLYQQYAPEGLPPDTLRILAEIESNHRADAQNPWSSAGGLFQFTDSTADAYGLSGDARFDPEKATQAAAKLASDNAHYLRSALGREPTVGELYLAHQQGMGGATALLSKPNQNVVDALVPLYGSRSAAERVVRQNGGKVNQTAGQFASQWVSKAEKVQGRIPPGEIPNTVASKLDTQRPPPPLPRPRPDTTTRDLLRSATPTTQDTASLYRGIFPQQAPSAPLPRSQPSMVLGTGIRDSFAAANAASSPDLAAQLAAYAAPKAPAPSMRQPSASERTALAYVAPPRVTPAANGRDLQRAEQTQRLQPRVTTVASIPTTPTRAQLPPIPPSRVASPRVVETTMERAAAARDPQLAAAIAAPRQTAQRQPTTSERAALAYVAPKAPTVAAAPRQPNAAERAALSYVRPPAPVQPVQPVRMNDTGKPLPSFGDFQTTFGPPAIPGPRALPKIGEERLVAGTWGVPSIAGLPRLPGQDMGVGTALSVMPPLPRARPTMQPVQMASVPLPRPRPAPVQQAPQRRPLFALPTPLAQRPAQRAPLNVLVQGARTQQPVQQAPQQVINPANHSAAQLEALAAGRSSYTGSDGGLQPVYAMNGKLRNTY